MVRPKFYIYHTGRAAQPIGVLSHTLKGFGFDSWSGHILRLWVSSPVRAHMGGNKSMFLTLIFLSH